MEEKNELNHSQFANELVALVEDYLEKIDEEMEIGQYTSPDSPPDSWDEEEDGNYHEAVQTAANLASSARMRLDDFLRKFKGDDGDEPTVRKTELQSVYDSITNALENAGMEVTDDDDTIMVMSGGRQWEVSVSRIG